MPNERWWVVRDRVALGALLAGVVAYPAAWDADPYIFALAAFTLGLLQGALGLIGIVARLLRFASARSAVAWIVDCLLIACVVAAFAILKSVSWA
jgi:hypothetical protein